jgi:Fur family ferric uptake transcriptional regulator
LTGKTTSFDVVPINGPLSFPKSSVELLGRPGSVKRLPVSELTPLEKFREFLLTKGERLTRERSIIVEEVFAEHEHFDADTLIARVGRDKTGRRVSRATVYRALKLLEEAGLLRKVARPNGSEVYEHDYGYPQHDHLICGKCGELIEFTNEAISAIVEKICNEHSFLKTGHRLEVYGTCSKCNVPPQRRHRKLDLV